MIIINKKEEIAKLLLRILVGGLLLFHGIHKIIYGIEEIKSLFYTKGLAEIFAYFAYVGEVISPVLLILGIYTRSNAFIIFSTLIIAIITTQLNNIFVLTKVGGLSIELQLFYIMISFVIILVGPGIYKVKWKGLYE